MIKCEAYLRNRDEKAGALELCEATATVTYYDCCGNYLGTPMCDDCAAVDQGDSDSCYEAEIVPLTA